MLNNVWNSVVFHVGKATDDILSSRKEYTWFDKQDKTLIYKSQRAYDSFSIQPVKRLGFQLAEHYADLLTDFASAKAQQGLQWLRGHKRIVDGLNQLERERRQAAENRAREEKERRKLTESVRKNYEVLIANGTKQSSGLGVISVQGGQTVNAVDPYGNAVPEALMLYYDTKVERELNLPYQNKTIKTKTLFFIDINAQVSQSTSKNVILTKVQGRDHTRKELVSGGDVSFTINGMMNSNQPGIYPEQEVKKFIELCQYNGIVKVNHILFKQFNVDRIIIQDFKLAEQECKNEQRYSMTCVAVEPSDPVSVSKDTIQYISDALAASSEEGWYKALLDKKKKEANNGVSDKTNNPVFNSNKI